MLHDSYVSIAKSESCPPVIRTINTNNVWVGKKYNNVQ